MLSAIHDKALSKRNTSIEQLSMQINEILCLINEQITAEIRYRARKPLPYIILYSACK